LPHGKVLRLPLFQSFKHQIDRILEILIILPDLRGVDEFDQRIEVLLFLRCLIVDVSYERRVEEGLRL
jgi:hypothetical protein